MQTLRFQNWWIAKIAPLLSYAYIILFLQGAGLKDSWYLLILLVVWMIGAAAFGHYVNDIFDLQDDLKAGKANKTEKHGLALRIFISIGLAALALLPWLILPANRYNIALVVLHLFIFLVYSSPPLRLSARLKELRKDLPQLRLQSARVRGRHFLSSQNGVRRHLSPIRCACCRMPF